jgi:heme exporter protein D
MAYFGERVFELLASVPAIVWLVVGAVLVAVAIVVTVVVMRRRRRLRRAS